MTHDKHIKALDGLRFIAAFSVMISHGTWYIIALQREELMSFVLVVIMHLSNFGMTLFFVLSGFVIHVNYRDLLPKPGGPKKFFVARWSRLYPLFFVVFVIQVTYTWKHQGPSLALLGTMPFYLAFVESWWYWPVYSVPAQAAYDGATALMWSISTEAFFYLSYPFIASGIARLTPRRAAFAIVLTTICTIIVCSTIVYRQGEINAWAAVHVDAESSGGFAHWLGYYSPWVRIFEFLIGAFAAQLYMAGYRPRRPDLLAAGCCTIIAAVYLGGLYVQTPMGMSDTTICAACFGGLCLAGTPREGRFARLMGARPMVLGGEASYSLYLLHYWVLHTETQPLVASLLWRARVFWLIVAMAAAICLSRLVFVLFERPAMNFFRSGGTSLSLLARKKRPVSEPPMVLSQEPSQPGR